MSFYARWQPLHDEDQLTALAFGFLRHAPVSLALEPWLSRVLDRPVTAEPLRPSAVWPLFPSVLEGSTATEPELVFDANDAVGPLTVVVEVKLEIGMQTIGQLSREVVDVTTHTGAARIALITVDPDPGNSTSVSNAEEQVRERVRAHSGEVEAQIYHSSFAELGQVIAAAGKQNTDWKPYADDVTHQLRNAELLGYQGAAMLDDLEPLTLGGVVEAYNRIVAAARNFYLELHQHNGFRANRLEPDLGPGDSPGPRMLRDGRTDRLTRPAASFHSRVILGVYRHPDLDQRSRLFVAFDLSPRDSSGIELLAGRWDYESDNLAANATTFSTALTRETRLADPHAQLQFRAWAGVSRWNYDRRRWQPGRPTEDLDWTIDRMTTASKFA